MWYKDWFNSPYYHKLYFERDEHEAKAFIGRLIKYLNPAPNSRMIDVACGKGRHSIELASFGFEVTGIDISPDSIAYAKRYETNHLEFYVHDMLLPFWGNYFDYAFNFFTSFGYFKTRREHDDAIQTISKSLRQGGVFMIDYLNVHYAEDHLRSSETKVLSGTIYDIHRWDDESHFYKQITVKDEALPSPLAFTEKVAKFSLGDFTDMLGFHAMQVIDVFGDYRLDRYDVKRSPRLILMAKKTTRE